jgi:hypothetical protein
MSETESVATVLRRAFKPEEIGKLPRVTCGDCSDKRKDCSKHSKSKCDVCLAWISEKHIHIDYVGHADVTSRLLEADEGWSWEPQARDIDPAVLAAAVAAGPDVIRLVLENAPPKYDLDERGNPVGLWIRLTVGGQTRPGYGSCPSGQGDAVKVLIGDALRNAAMRFGVALALWAKGDRADPAAENATASAGQVDRRQRPQSAAAAFDQATPAPARPSNGNGSAPAGRTERPAAATRPAPTGEPDPEAQPYADEASQCTTGEALKAVNAKARDAHKLAQLITNPSTGGVGGLGQYIGWKRNQLEKADRALAALREVAQRAGLDDAELDKEMVTQAGHGLEAASAEEMDTAAAKISETFLAVAS